MKKRVAAGIMAGIMAMVMLSGCGGGTKEADAEVKKKQWCQMKKLMC